MRIVACDSILSAAGKTFKTLELNYEYSYIVSKIASELIMRRKIKPKEGKAGESL